MDILLLLVVATVVAVGILMIPLYDVFRGKVKGKGAKSRLWTHIAGFFGIVFFSFLIPALSRANVFAAEGDIVDLMTGTLAQGLGFLSAALATGLSSLGAGIAVAAAAPAAIGAFSENEKNFGKSLIFVALGEGVAIYGLLISILIINSL